MLRFAVVGTNWITDAFVDCAEATGRWKLRAVYSRTEDTARSFGDKYGRKTTYTSLDGLAKDATVQVVYVASPNSLHYEQTKLFLSAGKHVIVEKPATSTVAELDELFAVAKRHKVYLIEAYRHIQEGNFQVIRDALQRLGPIHGASLGYANYSSRYRALLAGERPSIFSLDFSGGCLVDLGVYPICFAVALFGKPESQTYKASMLTQTGADGAGLGLLQYNGFGVTFNCSKTYTSTAPSEIYGQNGTLIIGKITDIDRISFRDAASQQTDELAKSTEWLKAANHSDLNLQEEAAEFARIIETDDREAAEKLEQISRAVLDVTVDLRHQNGIVFAAEGPNARS